MGNLDRFVAFSWMWGCIVFGSMTGKCEFVPRNVANNGQTSIWDNNMKDFGKFAIGAALLSGAVLFAIAPASARDNPNCRDPHWAYENSKFCPSIYGRGGIPINYAERYGYYDSGYYGPGYYEPSATGFVYIDADGHRRTHNGRFNGGGFHGHSSWHKGHR